MSTPRVAAVHDLSCFGRCALTIVMPTLSALGVQCCPVPTALLSTHTGGFSGFTYRDLTEDLLPMAEHWKSLGCRFQALYSGFLGSAGQIGLVEQIFEIVRSLNKQGSTILLVEQNAQMALSVADRGYVLETGHIVKTAPAHTLLEDEDVKRAYLGG